MEIADIAPTILYLGAIVVLAAVGLRLNGAAKGTARAARALHGAIENGAVTDRERVAAIEADVEGLRRRVEGIATDAEKWYRKAAQQRYRADQKEAELMEDMDDDDQLAVQLTTPGGGRALPGDAPKRRRLRKRR